MPRRSEKSNKAKGGGSNAAAFPPHDPERAKQALERGAEDAKHQASIERGYPAGSLAKLKERRAWRGAITEALAAQVHAHHYDRKAYAAARMDVGRLLIAPTKKKNELKWREYLTACAIADLFRDKAAQRWKAKQITNWILERQDSVYPSLPPRRWTVVLALVATVLPKYWGKASQRHGTSRKPRPAPKIADPKERKQLRPVGWTGPVR